MITEEKKPKIYHYWIGIHYSLDKISSFCGCPVTTKNPIDSKEYVLKVAEYIREHHGYDYVSIISINFLRKE